MKKAILIVSALLLVVSGVAAVSAHEAHLINVKAKVENALTVDTTAMEMGTMFPQEWKKTQHEIRLSNSAQEILGVETGNLTSVSFSVYATCKPIPGSVDEYYEWIGEWLWVAWDAEQTSSNPMVNDEEWTRVGPRSCTCGVNYQIIGGDMCAVTLDSTTRTKTLDILFLAPCFEDYWYEITDCKPTWWPTAGTDWPLILKTDTDRYHPEGIDLGLDLVIQVCQISRVPPE